MDRILNYINGKLIEPDAHSYIPVYEPATGEQYSEVPDSDESDVQKAFWSAKAAFRSWSTLSSKERADYLFEIADMITDRLDLLSIAESKDNGKPIWLAQEVDIPRAASNFEFFASGIQHFASEAHEMRNKAINYTLRLPLGVVGAISPWNLPLYLFTWKIAPALAAGNTVVAKPSEITPMTAYLLSEICIELGLPPGVLNIIHGYGHKVGEAITTHPDLKAISFTGSTKTGERIARNLAPKFTKYSLEMGGKNPNIIFADCDYEKMLQSTTRSSFRNQGEICLCGSRILIEESLYERFKQDFIERTKALRVGDPSSDVDLGAIVSKQHFDKIMMYIGLAKEEGGTILAGGNSAEIGGRCSNGWFIEPTIIEGLDHTCRVNREEIFGPVVTLQSFKDEDEMLSLANATDYGLSATLWTQDVNRVHRLVSKIEAGIIWVNTWMLRDLRTPFGGIKQSGVGREGGFDALRFFTDERNVCIDYS